MLASLKVCLPVCFRACPAVDPEPVFPQPASERASVPLTWTSDSSHPTSGREHFQ